MGALILLASPVRMLAQDGASAAAGPQVAFPQVTGAPVPLHSASGRFSSLNPLDQKSCAITQVSGRVISPRLIIVKHIACGRPGHDNMLVNVQLSNPADAAQMVPGRQVTIAARFKTAIEDRDPTFVAEFLIAANAKIVAEDRSASPVPAFTSYMLCQPPELDALATRLGSDLCVQNTILADLPAAGAALETAARKPARIPPQDALPGDPNAISCRLDPGVSDHHLSDIACARNSYWAWYKAKWHDPLSSIPAPP